MTIALNIFTSFGRLTSILLAEHFLSDVGPGWRVYLRVNSLFSLIAPILVYFFVYESPRYLIMKRDFTRGFEEFDRMGFINHGPNFV